MVLRKNRAIGYLLTLIICIESLFIGSFSVNAADEFEVSQLALNHASISFEINDAVKAEKMTMVIDLTKYDFDDDYNKATDSKAATHVEIPFCVESPDQSFELGFPNEAYLASNLNYTVQILNEKSECVFETSEYFGEHSLYSFDYSFEPRGGYVFCSDGNTKSITISIGFDKYVPEKKEGDRFWFEYPEQVPDTPVKILLSDTFGCEENYKTVIDGSANSVRCIIRDEKVLANRTCAEVNAYGKGKYRLCAEISGEKYYSDYYDIKDENEEQELCVEYPTAPADTKIRLWVESLYGAKTSDNEYMIYKTPYKIKAKDILTSGLYAYLYDAETDNVVKNVTSAKLIINDKEYTGTKDKHNGFDFKYTADVGDTIKLLFADENGYEYTKSVTVPQGDGKLEFLKCNADGAVFRFHSNYSKIKDVTLYADNKKYKVKDYSQSDYNQDKKSGFSEYNKSFKYLYDWDYKKSGYLVKIGKKVTIKVTTDDGYFYTTTAQAEEIEPYLSLDPVYSSDDRVWGCTDEKAKITIKIGNKKYAAKPNKYGYFFKKIKPAKSGTKVKVSVVIPQTGCKASKNIKIRVLKGSSGIKNTLYKNSNRVNVSFKKARKGDKLKLVIGNKKYSYTFSKNKDKGSYTFNTGYLTAGAKVKLFYTDSFGKSKAYTKTAMVYIGNDIYKGMSAHDCELTTWGRAVRKNDYSYNLQWVFERNGSTLYAYIKNGYVYSIQRFNY